MTKNSLNYCNNVACSFCLCFDILNIRIQLNFDAIAYAIATVICHLDIPQFIIGGMFSYVNRRSGKVGTFFLETIKKKCLEKYLFTKVPAFKLRFAEYIDYAAALGGALYGYENYFQQLIRIGEKNIAISVT